MWNEKSKIENFGSIRTHRDVFCYGMELPQNAMDDIETK